MTEILITSSVLILAVLLLRRLLKGRINPRLQYALWLLVALRLLVPVSVPAPTSVMNTRPAEAVQQAIGQTAEYEVQPELPVTPATPMAPEQTQPAPTPQTQPTNWAKVVWLGGAAAVGLWFAVANLRFYARLKKQRQPLATSCPLPVYLAEDISSPCLFGLVRPAVYVTPQAAAAPQMLDHVLRHEHCHFRQGDHIWSLVRILCLTFYWFDPLVWVAALCSRTDCELACDRLVVNTLGEGERAAYGRTLVELVQHRQRLSYLACTATTMAAKPSKTKERVATVLKNPKTAVPILLAVLACVALLVGCTFTGQAAKQPPTQQEVIELAQKAEAVYQMGNDELLEIVSFEEPFEVEGIEGPIYYDEIDNYDQVVTELFTQQGLDQLEASRYQGLTPAILKQNGKVYRASSMTDNATTRYYDTITAVELLEQEDGRFTYQISHTAKTRWEETEDMASRLVLVRQKDKLLVESFEYPLCVTKTTIETAPEGESLPAMQPGVLYALTDQQALAFPSRRTEAGQDELDRWDEIINSGAVSRFDGRTMGERVGVITADQAQNILLTLQNAQLGLFENMGNPSTGGQLELVAYDAAGQELLHCLYDGSWFTVQFAEEDTAYVFDGSVAGWNELESQLEAAQLGAPLDEQNAQQTIDAILQNFVITATDEQQTEGSLRFVIPAELPQLPEGMGLYATLNLTFSTGAGSSRVEALLDWATDWQPGQVYSSRWQQGAGETLTAVMLRMAYMTDLGDGSFQEYAAGYVTLQQPLPFGQNAHQSVAEMTANGQNVRVGYTNNSGQTTALSMTLPRGTELMPDDGRRPLFRVCRDGIEIGSLQLHDYGTTDPDDLQEVDPASGSLPMQIFSPIALANHVDYQTDYWVVGKTATASWAVCRMRYQQLEGAESAAAAPWIEQDCILGFDLAAQPMFVAVHLQPEALTAAELESWAGTMQFEQ